MRYIFLLIIALHVTLLAEVYSFDTLRDNEKKSALAEFKKLHKIRKNIHQNMRQVLKHARSKNLHKNHLSFFQPKDAHPMELSNVFKTTVVPSCEADCQASPSTSFDSDINSADVVTLPEGINSNFELSGSSPDMDAVTETFPVESVVKKESEPIRGMANSPWAKR